MMYRLDLAYGSPFSYWMYIYLPKIESMLQQIIHDLKMINFGFLLLPTDIGTKGSDTCLSFS